MPRFLHTADWQIGRHSLVSTLTAGRAHTGRFAEDDAALLAEARFTAKFGRLPTAREVKLWGIAPPRGQRAAFL